MPYKSEYINSLWIKFTDGDDPDRAFFKIMFKLDDFIDEASAVVADNGFVYLYVFADKESYNNRHKKNGVIKKPFVAVNQKAKIKANYDVKRKLKKIQNERRD